jgi:acetolactate synthase-1/2/3 large subunit
VASVTAAQTQTVAGRLAAFIASQGLEQVFSLPGGHMKPLWDELTTAGVRIVTARHEVAAVHMAQAEADLRGRPAVAIVTAGPGFTNAITGIACAYLAHSPVVVVSTRPPGPQTGMGALEEIEQAAVVRPICRAVEVVSHPRHLLSRLDRAVSTALGDDGPAGPVYVEFPCELLRAPAYPAYEAEPAAPRLRAPRPPDPEAVARAAELVRESRRPVVISGRDGVEDPDALRTFVAATGALYLDTRASRGSVSDTIGTYAPAVRGRAMAEADLVVTVGRALDFELAYGSPAIFREARFLRIGRTFDEVADNRRADVEVRADVGPVLESMVQSGCAPVSPDHDWLLELLSVNAERIERSAASAPEEADGADGRMHPRALLSAVNELVDAETIVVVDGGDILSFARRDLRAPTYLDLGPFGCLGVGVPFAISASLNYPDRRVIAVVGDGALGFNAMEIETAVREGARIIVVVANNGAFNIERQDQLDNYGGRIVGTELSDCAFDELARALGAHGERVENLGGLRPALKRAVANAPAVVDVAVTRDALSSDSRHGLALVPPFQALADWDEAERRWVAEASGQTTEKEGRMPVTIHQPTGREAPRGFSEATSGGGIVAVSGQLAAAELLDHGASFAEQFVSALTRFVEVLESSGATAADVLMMRIYVTSVDEYKGATREFGGAYRDTFGGRYPATTLVEVSGLIDDRAMVEIEGMAAAP